MRLLGSRDSNDTETTNTKKLHILCPLAGDDPFVQYAWSQGHSVVAADLVPVALQAMRAQFTGSWVRHVDGTAVVWTHASGRATLYETDILLDVPAWHAHFDAVYDKDSFGALEKDMRNAYCERLAVYLKAGGIIYTEVKIKGEDHPRRHEGPPFSIDEAELMESFGSDFCHVASLGEVYPSPMPNMFQTGHVLRRKTADKNAATGPKL